MPVSSLLVFSFNEFNYLVSASIAEFEICWLDYGLGGLIVNFTSCALVLTDADISLCYSLDFII